MRAGLPPIADPDVCDVTASDDPVAAFLEAHRSGRMIALRTSGTTGAARSVVRTTQSWVSSFEAVTSLLGMSAASRLWVPGPLTSTMNLFAAVHAAALGADRVESAAGATHAVLTPTHLGRLLAADTALPDVHLLVAGDRLGTALHGQAVRSGAQVSHYYGAAELSFVAWGSHAANLQPFVEVEISVREGVLWVRSPYVCQGYVGVPGRLDVDGDGWASVGDRGELRDGILRVAGRGTEVVTTAGATVVVCDVEDTLRDHAAGAIHAVGVPHPALGQVLVAVLTGTDDLGPVRAASRARLAPSHRPRRWFHLPDLPVTPCGKVDREALARLVTDGAARRLG